MRLTRLSLYYVVSYLTVAGLALLLVPNFALTLLLSNGDYGDIFPRFVGMTLLGLDVLVFQIVRLRVEQLYSTTLAVRIFFLVVLAALFVLSSDPFFLVVFAIVGVGVLVTGYSYLRERGSTGS
jgi:peptidoglycan/LPS O-acetylase OafA/YrhL